MPVILAKSAGFCYGVERAVKLAEQTAREKGGCVMLGSIIHNAHVVRELEALGARQADDVPQIQPGETVIIRSHGERKQVYEALTAIGADIVDATCPNVRRIQRLVARAGEEGRIPLVIGEQHHPEVIGAASWAADSVIVDGPQALEKWLAERPEQRTAPLMAAAQTTCIRSLWENCVKILKKQCTNAEIFDTICDATHKRQSEAAEIAAMADVMVVVGDRKSANTKHLTEICSERCPVVYQIERADELKGDFLNGCSVAGLTAGASTPAGIIKEVYAAMSEEIKAAEGKEESFEELLNQSFKTLNNGDRVTGIVTAITPTEVQVDVGAKQAAYIKLSELSDDPNVKPEDLVHVGDEIETWVVRVNDVEGYAELSKKRLDAAKVWENIEQAVEDKTILEGTVTEENKGGIVVSVKGVRAFVPENLQPHTVLAARNVKGRLTCIGGKYADGAVTATTRTTGELFVVADTIPPRIRPLFTEGADLTRASGMRFRVGDNFSGIASCTLFIDGKWVPCDRLPMQDTLIHLFEEPPARKSHSVRLTLTDACGNTACWEGTIRR